MMRPAEPPKDWRTRAGLMVRLPSGRGATCEVCGRPIPANGGIRRYHPDCRVNRRRRTDADSDGAVAGSMRG
jgi:hypothetical protein